MAANIRSHIVRRVTSSSQAALTSNAVRLAFARAVFGREYLA
jgi:hypothetical protein